MESYFCALLSTDETSTSICNAFQVAFNDIRGRCVFRKAITPDNFYFGVISFFFAYQRLFAIFK